MRMFTLFCVCCLLSLLVVQMTFAGGSAESNQKNLTKIINTLLEDSSKSEWSKIGNSTKIVGETILQGKQKLMLFGFSLAQAEVQLIGKIGFSDESVTKSDFINILKERIGDNFSQFTDYPEDMRGKIKKLIIEWLQNISNNNSEIQPAPPSEHFSMKSIYTIIIMMFMVIMCIIFLIKHYMLPTQDSVTTPNHPTKRPLDSQSQKPVQKTQKSSYVRENTGNTTSKKRRVKESPMDRVELTCDEYLQPIVTSYMNDPSWRILGASVVGNSHLTHIPPLPCQDSHCLEKGTEWGIAVVCDGAGSASHSHIGSQFVAKQAAQLFKTSISSVVQPIPKQQQEHSIEQQWWRQIAKDVFKQLIAKLEMLASEKHIELKSLACTVIVVIFSPKRLLITHIGDGRGGYRDSKGDWKSFLTPFKGEEANQTVFITSDIWDEPDKYIRSHILDEDFTAFVIMSDGCESHCFQTYNSDNTGHIIDVNKPHPNFFEPLFKQIKTSEFSNSTEVQEKWGNFIESGTEGFKNESDDKTMLIGVLLKPS